MSIAGVIGASLFVGSSVRYRREAGPAVLLAYLFAGLLVVMIMRMLAVGVPRPIPVRFPPMPIKPLAAGRAIPSAGCTGAGVGYWLSHWKPTSPP
ncbi:hypothetical protein ACLB1Q_29610 [Escherichia coli]